MLPEDSEPAHRSYVGRRATNVRCIDTNVRCIDTIRSPTGPRLGCQRQVRRPQNFSCHASFPMSFATELHEEAHWKHLLALYYIFTEHFGLLKFFAVVAHMHKCFRERR